MHKMISEEELLEIANDGGSVSKEAKERGPVELSGLSDLITQLSRIATANEKVASKQSERLTDVLEKLTLACGQQKINLNPIINMVRELKEMAKPKEIEHPSYEFEIVRDNRGLMKSVKATPTQGVK